VAGLDRRRLLGAAGAAAGGLVLGRPATGAASTDVLVRTREGVLRGRPGVWKGIRYAQPPGRFAAPRPVLPWRGVRDALEFGPSAMQPAMPVPGGPPPVGEQSEDCLFLNVWSPSTAGRRPVVVWLHGGAFVFGTSSAFDGGVLAGRGGLVVVTINYRLGAFGGLVGAGGPGSGNLRLLDQVAALRWVRRNIAAFGGDPANVTVMGESAGAMSIGALLGAPAAAGLFRRAIVQSGGPRPVVSRAAAARTTDAVLRFLGVTDPARLPSAPAADLVAATDAVQRDTALAEPFGHVLDGVVLPAHPLDRVGGSVDLLIGTCAKEADPLLPALGARFEASARAALGDREWDRLLRVYAETAVPGHDARADLLSGWFAVLPSVWLAEAAHRAGASAWQYTFDYAGASRFGAGHGSDVPFTFGRVDPAFLAPGADPVAAQRLAGTVVDALAAFARTGDPGWPRFAPDRRASLSFDVPPRRTDDRLPAARREAWSGIDPRTVC